MISRSITFNKMGLKTLKGLKENIMREMKTKSSGNPKHKNFEFRKICNFVLSAKGVHIE